MYYVIQVLGLKESNLRREVELLRIDNIDITTKYYALVKSNQTTSICELLEEIEQLAIENENLKRICQKKKSKVNNSAFKEKDITIKSEIPANEQPIKENQVLKSNKVDVSAYENEINELKKQLKEADEKNQEVRMENNRLDKINQEVIMENNRLDKCVDSLQAKMESNEEITATYKAQLESLMANSDKNMASDIHP